MNKILSVIMFSFLFISVAHAGEVPDGVYFFGDGNGYNPSGEHTHFCLQDRNCYTVDGKFAFQREVQGVVTTIPSPTPQTVYVPIYIPAPVVGNVPTPPSNPAPATQAPVTQAPVTILDTTAPKILWSLGSEHLATKERGCSNCVYVETDEPTTATVYFMHNLLGWDDENNKPIKEHIISSTNSSKIHKIFFEDAGLVDRTLYRYKLTVTDLSGNTTTNDYFTIYNQVFPRY